MPLNKKKTTSYLSQSQLSLSFYIFINTFILLGKDSQQNNMGIIFSYWYEEKQQDLKVRLETYLFYSVDADTLYAVSLLTMVSVSNCLHISR